MFVRQMTLHLHVAIVLSQIATLFHRLDASVWSENDKTLREVRANMHWKYPFSSVWSTNTKKLPSVTLNRERSNSARMASLWIIRIENQIWTMGTSAGHQASLVHNSSKQLAMAPCGSSISEASEWVSLIEAPLDCHSNNNEGTHIAQFLILTL